MKAHIQFKYISDEDNEEKINLKFEDPTYYRTAHNINEVQSLVEQAERFQREGYFVILTLPYESAQAFDASLKVHENVTHFGSLQAYKEPVLKFANQHEKENYAEQIEWHETKNDMELKNDIKTIQEEITLGNTYQVNYTTRLKAKSILYPYAYFQLLTYESNGDYQAFIESDEETIISVSPELFFQTGPHSHLEHCIITKPMKGTIGRSNNPEEDDHNFKTLQNSNKDKAENVMIVDLLRNDLSKISKVGTVDTIHLFMIEKYKTVYQMTSTVRSEIENDMTLFKILQALFPCGSITGAPKEATMKIINKLEAEQRGIYCGTIGLLMPDGRRVFNVPIRTVQNTNDGATYGVGAGITIDSNPEAEINEFKMKAKILDSREVHLIETMRLEAGVVKRRNEHTNRISKSAAELNINFDIDEWNGILDRVSEKYTSGTFKLRTELTQAGEIKPEVKELAANPQALTAKMMQTQSVPSVYTTNKTSARRQFDHNHETNVVLYYNEDNEITEFDIGNVVIKSNDAYFTPPFEGQILNGCMRQSLLKSRTVIEQSIQKDELIKGIKRNELELYMVNSLREWVKIDLKL